MGMKHWIGSRTNIAYKCMQDPASCSQRTKRGDLLLNCFHHELKLDQACNVSVCGQAEGNPPGKMQPLPPPPPDHELLSTLVAPCEPTPSDHLPLSPIDTRLPNHFFPKMLQVYGRGENPTVVVKEAISKALVPYYPVAGRIQALDDHDMVVNCNGAGVYFVEASADSSLGDASFLDKPPFKIPTEQLLPCPPPDVAWKELTFLMQVTQFKCGGFTIGIALNHIFFDGWGVAQFWNAIAEISRGLQPSAKPIWYRDSIQDPQCLSFVSLHDTLASSFNDFEEYVEDISADQISKLKKYLIKQTGETYSTFDILAAITWQYRARILGLEPDTDISLTFPIYMRRILPRVLSTEGTYYGNYYCDSILRASNKYISHAPLAEIAKMIGNGKTWSYNVEFIHKFEH